MLNFHKTKAEFFRVVLNWKYLALILKTQKVLTPKKKRGNAEKMHNAYLKKITFNELFNQCDNEKII